MKGGYDHFMKKEIHEQPDSVQQTMSGRVRFQRTSSKVPPLFSGSIWSSCKGGTSRECCRDALRVWGLNMLARRVPLDWRCPQKSALTSADHRVATHHSTFFYRVCTPCGHASPRNLGTCVTA